MKLKGFFIFSDSFTHTSVRMNQDHELVALREKHTDARLPFLVAIHSDGGTFCHFVLQNTDPYFSSDVPAGRGLGSAALCSTKKSIQTFTEE